MTKTISGVNRVRRRLRDVVVAIRDHEMYRLVRRNVTAQQMKQGTAERKDQWTKYWEYVFPWHRAGAVSLIRSRYSEVMSRDV